ncbi:MAG: hypothetical protein KGK33_05440 [Hyphomicrobiales bacterium]|jgi:hypothetical protein|nr:hypothetical protein [Hyphomicrobiales bacterium]
MANYPVMSVEAANSAADIGAGACPGCSARLMLRRSAVPSIDECGFESYRLACHACGAPLAGIIDPADDQLLLSLVAA